MYFMLYMNLFYVDVKFFSEQLEKYHREHKEAVALRPTRNVGLLLIDTKQLKEKLIPSPLRCLEVTMNQKKFHCDLYNNFMPFPLQITYLYFPMLQIFKISVSLWHP